MRELIKARLAPFRHRHFRNFFIAQTLSLVGTWSHDLARSWVIVEATGSSGALGNLNLCLAVPCLFLILQGGVLVDRVDVRILIQWTKSLLAIACLILGALTEFSHLQVWHLMVFAVIEGVIIAYDSPAFQALTVRLVPRSEFQQAIALNSTNFHTSRMLGPVVAAWIMSMGGPGLVFLFDGLTYLIVAFVLATISFSEIIPKKPKISSRQSLLEGFRYIFGTPTLRFRLMQLCLTLCCVQPMMVAIFRVYVQQKFNLDAKEFGAVFSFPAMGSMAGALTFAVFKPREPLRVMFLGIPLVFLTLMSVPWFSSIAMTVAAMTLTGFGQYLSFASMTVSMQLDVKEEFRGRLSSLVGMGFSAISPMMTFPWGHLADWIGPPNTIFMAGTVFGIGSAVLAFAYQRHIKPQAPSPV